MMICDRLRIMQRVRGTNDHQLLRAPALPVLLLSLALLTACHRHYKQAAHIPPPPSSRASASSTKKGNGLRRSGTAPAVPVGYTEEGVASWYGVPYHGRPAADGEIYDMEKLVAAHRLLPFNTWLKVTNLSNGKEVKVRVIDRGPFVQGRILDLSKAAARDIDLLGPGVGRIRLEVVSAPADNPVNDFYAVQVGAFSVYEHADELRARYAGRFGDSQLRLKQGSVPIWRVLVGKEPTVEAAQQLMTVLAAENKSVFIVRLDPTTVIPPSSSERVSVPARH
jgi:rare lipoprotein A